MSTADQAASAHRPALPSDFGPRTHPGLLVRWRARRKAAELDQALAAGSDPLANECLLWRAQRLTEPIERLNLAEAIRRLVHRVDSGEVSPQPRVGQIQRDVIENNRSLLLVLAERLHSDAPIALRGLAMVELLVRYPNSPLYCASQLGLKWRLLDILAGLDPRTPVDAD